MPFKNTYCKPMNMQAVSCWSGYKAVMAVTQVNRYWGIVTIGWAPFASIATTSATAIISLCLWHVTDTKSKPGLLLGQLGMQLLCAGCMLLATWCWLHTGRVDPQVSHRPVCARMLSCCRCNAAVMPVFPDAETPSYQFFIHIASLTSSHVC